ncbi:hypothetical protein DPEC_G00123710 [Dallia pectoralis]|uniref:Uncharacterized protein n=1 Tax=Dallia pectoralis TaxID=75939 RepID=A0ACC2GQH8_DALPE|nr:hypothetical protein DPEC_G00123710 [Dallia pectoralis]
MERGLSSWAIVAIVCNSVVGFLTLILFVILYRACKVPSRQEGAPVLLVAQEHRSLRFLTFLPISCQSQLQFSLPGCLPAWFADTPGTGLFQTKIVLFV